MLNPFTHSTTVHITHTALQYQSHTVLQYTSHTQHYSTHHTQHYSTHHTQHYSTHHTHSTTVHITHTALQYPSHTQHYSTHHTHSITVHITHTLTLILVTNISVSMSLHLSKCSGRNEGRIALGVNAKGPPPPPPTVVVFLDVVVQVAAVRGVELAMVCMRSRGDRAVSSPAVEASVLVDRGRRGFGSRAVKALAACRGSS